VNLPPREAAEFAHRGNPQLLRHVRENRPRPRAGNLDDWFEIEGPRLRSIAAVSLIAATQDRAGARAVIERFATRAFRGRAPASEFLDRLVSLFESRRSLGDSFADALKEP